MSAAIVSEVPVLGASVSEPAAWEVCVLVLVVPRVHVLAAVV